MKLSNELLTENEELTISVVERIRLIIDEETKVHRTRFVRIKPERNTS